MICFNLYKAINETKFFLVEQHYQHFTRQLAQMTLSYLHNLMEDGAKILESKDLQHSFHADESGQVAHTPFYQEIKHCLEFLTQSVVKLRCHLVNMPLVGTERLDPGDVSGMSFMNIEMDEGGVSSKRWTEMTDEVRFYLDVIIIAIKTIVFFSLLFATISETCTRPAC